MTFRARLTLRWVLAFGLVLAAALLAVYFGIREFLERDFDAQLRTLAGTELASATDDPEEGVHLHEFERSQPSAEYADKFVQLITGAGTVLMQSPVLGDSPSLLDIGQLTAALSGSAEIATVAVDGRPGRMIALTTQGPAPYVVAVGLFTDNLEVTLSRVQRLLAAVWATSLAATALLGFTLASQALRPIRHITQKAAAIAEGQFGTRLDEPALRDEIGEMTRLLNAMLDQMDGAIEANRRFAADASHELRGPLTAMLGEIDVTLKRTRPVEEYRDLLQMLRQRLVEMAGIMEDLVLLVRAQERRATETSRVPVAELLEAIAARHQPSAERQGVRVRVDAAAPLAVLGEPRLLDRVFDNLVQNAVRHTPDGGTVTLSAHAAAGPAGATDGASRRDVVITVQDTGIGIPTEERERVFERFYRLDRSRSRHTGGTGLGLAIAREIIQLLGGRIGVVDRPGPGATIETRLPAA